MRDVHHGLRCNRHAIAWRQQGTSGVAEFIDNGNHFVVSRNAAVNGYLETVGASAGLIASDDSNIRE